MSFEALPPRLWNMTDLVHRLAGKRDALIALTQDLIRIPTLNPPGQNYLLICEYLQRRLSGHRSGLDLRSLRGGPK